MFYTAICNENLIIRKAFLCSLFLKIIFWEGIHMTDELRVNAVSLMQSYTPDLN